MLPPTIPKQPIRPCSRSIDVHRAGAAAADAGRAAEQLVEQRLRLDAERERVPVARGRCRRRDPRGRARERPRPRRPPDRSTGGSCRGRHPAGRATARVSSKRRISEHATVERECRVERRQARPSCGRRRRRSRHRVAASARRGRRRARTACPQTSSSSAGKRVRISRPVGGDDDLLLDPRGRAAVVARAVRLEREDHALLDLDRVVERVQSGDHRRLVQADAEAVAELEPEARLLVGKPSSSAVGQTAAIWSVVTPGRTSSIASSSHSRHCLYASSWAWRRAADAERAVVARPVAHERVDDVEERLVARAQQPVGEDVRVRVAAVARDGVDRLDLLGAELEQQPLRLGDDLVLAHARRSMLVDPLVDGVDDRRRVVEQRDLVLGLDLARRRASPAGVGRSGCPARCSASSVTMSVMSMPERLALEPVLAQLLEDRRGQQVRHAGLLRHRAAHARHAGPPARLRQPRRVQLVVRARRSRSPTGSGRRRAAQDAKRAFLSRAHSPMCVLVT